MKRIYLDHAATTPVDPEVVKEMLPYFSEVFGNPSSPHALGQEARRAVERARAEIASFLGASPDEIVFTGGGAESNNFALKGIARSLSARGKHVITTSIEHHSVLEAARSLEQEGFEVTYLPVDAHGLVDPLDVRKSLRSDTILISVMHANNEIGTIQHIPEIGSIAREAGVFFHTDAVQTFGHIPTRVDELHVALLSASAHKLYGPKGVGILYVREGTPISPLIHGGDQERHRRGSTLNVPGIVGMATAVRIARETMDQEGARLAALRQILAEGILARIERSRLNGHPTRRVPNNVSVSIEGIEGMSALIDLDAQGITCSTGAACTTSSVKPSHVLTALGLSEDLARGSLRFSLGRSTSEEDIHRVLDVLPRIVERVRALSPSYRAGRSFETFRYPGWDRAEVERL